MTRIHHFTQIDSTNDEAKRMIRSLPEGHTASIVVADRQTSGRGRGSNKWQSDDDGGLYYTLLLTCDSFLIKDVDKFVEKSGRIVVKVIQELTGIQTLMEWPNDIILNDKKCGGILIEAVSGSHAEAPDFIIIGVGLNLNQLTFPEPIKHVAISLRQTSQTLYNKSHFIEALTKEFFECR